MIGNREVLERFIVIEGIDGAGTTTQLRLAEHRFLREHIPYHTTAEPTSGPIGTLLRSILGGGVSVESGTVAHLFAADRYEHLYNSNDGILSNIKAGRWVVSDRYLFSSLAYQGTFWDYDKVHTLNSFFPLPEHLFFIETDAALSSSRRKSRESIEIYETDNIQSEVYSRYKAVIESFSDTSMKVHRINGSLDPETIHETLWKLLFPSDN